MWPWMVGAVPSVPPSHDGTDDDRTNVAQLIAQHRCTIDQLCFALSSNLLMDPAKHDDLWLLRFLLSHKFKVDKALKACQSTLQFRDQHDLDKRDIRFNPVSKKVREARACLEHLQDEAIVYVAPDSKRTHALVPVAIADLGGFDFHGMAKTLTNDEIESFNIYASEWTHQWLDFMTRTTGRLTKSIRIIDAKGMTTSKINRGVKTRFASCIDRLQDFYPQTLQTVFVCNTPCYVQGAWTILRPLLPKRLVQKVDFIRPSENPQDLAKLLTYMNRSHLPTHLGGSRAASISMHNRRSHSPHPSHGCPKIQVASETYGPKIPTSLMPGKREEPLISGTHKAGTVI